MDFIETLSSAPLILTGGSTFERLRRHPGITFDPDIKHGALIYDSAARSVLDSVQREYVDVARRHGLPMLVSASTWRASDERISRSPHAGRPVNQDNIRFTRAIADELDSAQAPLFVTAILGCRGDAYKPAQALDFDDAQRFHDFQVGALADGHPDVVLAATLPALSEARGIAACLDQTGLPYIISFVVRDDGTLLDGTPLGSALDTIDQERSNPPVGYMANCVHPTVLERAMRAAGSSIGRRLIGLRANTSTLRPEELDDAAELITQPPGELAADMRQIQVRGALRILGGCCGTGTDHIEAIASLCKEQP